MPVLNKHHGNIPPGAVYIGRGSKWGNPFTHKTGTAAKWQVGSRDEACDAHEAWLRQEITDGRVTAEDLAELHGKALVCFCAPARCHGYTLERFAQMAVNHLNQEK